jgi:hypothetical protein
VFGDDRLALEDPASRPFSAYAFDNMAEATILSEKSLISNSPRIKKAPG